MSKSSLPESMELLLDTMCNTFGGVMFITISLALTLFIANRNFVVEDTTEKDRQELEKVQAGIQRAELLREDLRKSLAGLREIPNDDARGQKEVKKKLADAQNEFNDIIRETELLQDKNKELTRKNNMAKSREAARAKKISAQSRDLKNKLNETEKVVADLEKKNEDLKEQLQNIPQKRLHFSREQKTHKNPYILLVIRDTLFCLGSDYFHSSPGVQVRQMDRFLFFTPLSGIAIAEIDRSRIPELLRNFDKHKFFLWVKVADDSFASFTRLRRDFRDLGYGMHWDSGDFYVTLVEHANYSESH